MGHEMVGTIEQVGDEVTALKVGDFVISPFSLSDGTCQSCRAGSTSVCDHVTFFGSTRRRPATRSTARRASSSACRSARARSSSCPARSTTRSSRTCSRCRTSRRPGTTPPSRRTSARATSSSWSATARSGSRAVLAASRLGASRIIAMSRHADRQAVAREFGATDIIEERGEEAIAALRALLDGDLADAALECVGTAESMEQALGSVRGGGRVGFVGVPGDRRRPRRPNELFDRQHHGRRRHGAGAHLHPGAAARRC